MEAQTALRAPTKEDDPKALLAILSGNGDGRPTEDSRAKAVWEGSSSKSGFAAWSKLMRDQARADIAALRASGELNIYRSARQMMLETSPKHVWHI